MGSRVREWFEWAFRAGKRGSMLLNMSPGDEVVSMIAYKQWLAVATRFGELYMISTDEFDHLDVDTVRQAVAHRVTP